MLSSGSNARYYVPRSVFVAVVAALASCTDAATLMLKMKDNAILRQKDAISVDGTSSTTTMKENTERYNFNTQNFTTNVANITDGADDDDGLSDEEALSAVWYLAAFGGLVLFFFVVTCSELFFGNPIYTRRQVELHHAGYLRRQVYGIRNHQHHVYTPDTPPPPYHLFAPPSYDDTIKGGVLQQQRKQCHELGIKKLADVYVVPIHAAGCATATTPAAAAAAVAVAGDVKLLAAVLPQTKFK